MSPPSTSEARRKGLEASQRFFKEHEEECERRAIANGFASSEEQTRAAMDEFTRRWKEFEKKLDEECAFTGKTREELRPDIYAQEESDPPTPILCDCDDHTFPFFCPKRLVQYRSMEIPAVAKAFAYERQPQLDEFRVEPGDVSRRLPDAALKRYWAVDSQKRPLEEAPLWSKGDKVLQRIAAAGPAVSIGTYGHEGPIPSDGISSNDIIRAGTAPQMSGVQMAGEGHTSLTMEATREHQSPLPLKKAPSRSRLRGSVASHQQRPRAKKTRGVCERELASITKSSKVSRRHGMQTRSQQPTRFYQL